jgi:hypothetical protein
MSCGCDYSLGKKPCSGFSCIADAAAAAAITQKIITKQVRMPASAYTMNLATITGAANRLASKTNTNWQQMSDRVLAAQQVVVVPTRGNSLRGSITSGKPGAGSPGGAGVDVKHDSYARYLNRKKAIQMVRTGQCCL